MAENELRRELTETIARYKALARTSESDPLTERLIIELVAELERQLEATDYPLAPKGAGDN